MMDIVNTTGSGLGFIALWGIHILSVIAFFVGVVFLIVLAIRQFSPVQLKNWAIGLIVGGTILCLFTILSPRRPWGGVPRRGLSPRYDAAARRDGNDEG